MAKELKTSVDFLQASIDVQEERGKVYDGGEKERSMPKIVAAFNALTGRDLQPDEGWLFMAALKLVRDRQNRPHLDSLLDATSYVSLYAEERAAILSANGADPRSSRVLLGADPNPSEEVREAEEAKAHAIRKAFTRDLVDAALDSIHHIPGIDEASVVTEFVKASERMLHKIEMAIGDMPGQLELMGGWKLRFDELYKNAVCELSYVSRFGGLDSEVFTFAKSAQDLVQFVKRCGIGSRKSGLCHAATVAMQRFEKRLAKVKRL